MSIFDINLLGVPLIELLFTFFLYSMCGYIVEVFYAALVLGKFVNRGFLSGPYCPIYGLAVAAVDVALSPAAGHPLLVFLGGIIVIDSIEYFGGLILFKAFHQRWWDYSNEPYNIGGYICLSFSLVWGFFALAVTYIMIPLTRLILEHIPHAVTAVFCAGMLIYMAADIIVTVLTIKKVNKKLEQIDRISNLIKHNSDVIGKTVSDKTLAAMDAVDFKEKAEEFNKFRESIPDPREVGIKETAEAVRDEIYERYIPAQAKETLDDISRRLTSGERRILLNIPDSARAQYRETLAKLKEKAGIKDISEARKKLTAVFSSVKDNTAETAARVISEKNVESLTKLLWVFVIGSFGGAVYESVLLLAGVGFNSKPSALLMTIPFYGVSAVAFTMALWRMTDKGFKGAAAIFTASAIFGVTLQYFGGIAGSTIITQSLEWNINPFSRTGVLSALFFGAVGTVWLKLICPRLLNIYELISSKKGRKSALVISAVISAVLIVSAIAVMFLH